MWYPEPPAESALRRKPDRLLSIARKTPFCPRAIKVQQGQKSLSRKKCTGLEASRDSGRAFHMTWASLLECPFRRLCVHPMRHYDVYRAVSGQVSQAAILITAGHKAAH